MKKQVLPIHQEQKERLAELGSRLRELRQQQEIPLEQVAGRTRIQPRLLRAIEQGNLGELPEPVYIHSFLRQYADAIGLNGVQFASSFPTASGMVTMRPSWRSLPGAQLRPIHLYLLYMFLIVAAVHGLSFFLNRSAESPATAELDLQKLPAIPTVTMGPSQPGATPANPVAPAAPADKQTTATQKPVRIGVKLTEQSWVRVMTDGKMEFEGVLPEGTQRIWMANKQVVIRAGNAGGVVVSFNDGQPNPLGQPGTIEEKAFPPESKMATLPE